MECVFDLEFLCHANLPDYKAGFQGLENLQNRRDIVNQRNIHGFDHRPIREAAVGDHQVGVERQMRSVLLDRAERLDEDSMDKVTAIEVFLFDKNAISTVTKVLMTDYCFGDDALRAEVAALLAEDTGFRPDTPLPGADLARDLEAQDNGPAFAVAAKVPQPARNAPSGVSP